MSTYLLSVVGTVLFASVLLAILPEGKSSDLIKSIVRTACLVVILSPIARFFVEWEYEDTIFVESGIQGNKDFIQYCREQRIEEAEDLLEKDLQERYSSECDVSLKWEMATVAVGSYTKEEIYISEIVVQTSGSLAITMQEEMKNYLFDTYGCTSVTVEAADETK